MTENKILMQQARESLAGKWGLVMGAFVIFAVIDIALSRLHHFGSFVSFLIGGPMALGFAIFSLSIARHKTAKISQIFEGFNDYLKSLCAAFLMCIFIFLWSLLLIVPGIIAALSYSQIFYILADDKSISAKDALEKSKKMMFGYKWKLVCLQLRFLGWVLLSILTCGIGFLWVGPYMQIARAKFYEDLLKHHKV